MLVFNSTNFRRETHDNGGITYDRKHCFLRDAQLINTAVGPVSIGLPSHNLAYLKAKESDSETLSFADP